MSLFESASLCITPNATKASKLYAIKPTSGAGDLTVTRATTATRVNSAGLIENVAVNVPRLDYTNSTCPSILVEPQRTNVQIQSEDFSNAVYLKIGSTITTNTTTAPDGTTTADKLVEDTSTGLHTALILAQQSTVADYTVSVFVKANGRTKFEIREGFSVGGNIKFDLTDETFTTTTPAKNGKIEKFANGWYRCSATWANLTGVSTQILLSPLNNSNASSYTGDGTSGVFLWGTQIELGSNSSSYIKTTTASVTRNADVISKTGISSLIGQTEGTIFFDGKINALPVDGSLFGIQKNASNFVIRFGSQGTNIYAQSYNGSANLFFEATPYNLGSRVKVAFAYKAGSYAFYINGVQIATGSNATAIPACDATMFNSLWGSFNDSVSFYSAAALYKTRLTNAELASITTL